MSDSKRHHWWPECHSRLWVAPDGCITMINRSGETRRTQPVNTAVIGHYNSVRRPDGTIDRSLETFFADEIEGKVGPVLARLATQTSRDLALEARYDKAMLRRESKGFREDGFVPDQRAFSAAFSIDDRRALARYIASLIVRVPSYKDELNSSSMQRNVAAVLGLDPDDARYETDLLHVEIVRRHLEQYAERLMSCEYVLVDAPASVEFIIGDTPVIPAALGFGEAEAMCPIAPGRALLIVSGWRAPFKDRIAIFRSLPKSVKAFNKTMAQNAEREIFCRATVPKEFVMAHLGTRQVRLAPDIATAGGEHHRGPMLDRAGHG